MGFRPRLISREWEIDAPLAQVWRVVADTDALNRAIGLPSVTVGGVHGNGLLRSVSATFRGVISMSWEEHPFEWVRDHRYEVRRDFTTGPLERFRGGIELTPADGKTRVRIHAVVTPRNFLGWAAVPFIGGDAVRRSWRYVQRVIQEESGNRGVREGQAGVGIATRPRADPTIERSVLGQRLTVLRERSMIKPGLIDALERHLMEADDEEVVHMRPCHLAERWGSDRGETARLFLHATRVGLLTLQWEVMCPFCRVAKAESENLAGVTRSSHCDTCGIDYDVNFDRYVELRFRVNNAIRQAKSRVYCFGGPSGAPHVLVQQVLDPGETRRVETTLAQEDYRLRVLKRQHAVLLRPVVRQDSSRGREEEACVLEYGDDGWTHPEETFAAGRVRLRWRNATSNRIGVVLERVKWDEGALTAAEVTTMQEFRDLFGSEVLAAGQEVAIESLTVLFSDLKDSTRLYESAGDAPAFGRVQAHFEFVRARVVRHRGAIVKTIGDAVMAVFFVPEDAVRCCLEIQRDTREGDGTGDTKEALTIKLGIHHGPAIAINANGRLDYFGRTVNVAARIARESDGQDLVMAKTLVEDPSVGAVLDGAGGVIVAEWISTLRGVANPLALCRVKLRDYNSAPSAMGPEKGGSDGIGG